MSAHARLLAALVATLALAAPASAQPWPSKPIKLVVGFAAGGVADVTARVVAQKLSDLWGQPVVSTQSMATGKFLTGAFQLGAQIFDRMDAMVEISTEDDQNFRKNLVTVLAEERLALAVYRPEAFVQGDFAATATAATAV